MKYVNTIIQTLHDLSNQLNIVETVNVHILKYNRNIFSLTGWTIFATLTLKKRTPNWKKKKGKSGEKWTSRTEYHSLVTLRLS